MANSFSKIYQRSTYRQFRVLDSLGVPYGTSLPASNTDTSSGSLFVLIDLADRTKDELYSYDAISDSWNQIKTTGAGKSAYEIAVDNGYVGTETDWLASLHGASGKSAYQEWVDNGHPGGTVEDFINSLKGQDGIGIPSGGATGEVLRKKSTDPYDVEWSTPAGGGDMLSSVYDPTGVNGDAFDYGNLHSVPVLDTTPTAALSGTANTYTGTFTPTVALTAGLKIRFMTNVDNTGASTLDADGTGAKAIVAPDGSALSGGELKADQYSEAVYNGTAWQLLGGGSGGGGGSIPPGGTTGQVLTKQSAADGDADWDDLPTELVWKADKASFPLTGEDGKAYVARDTGLMYRWDTTGSEYVLIGGGTGTPYLTFTGTDTYISTNSPAITAYPKALYGVFTNANTGSSTVKIDSLSALPVKLNGQNLASNNILANSIKLLLLASDNSHYQLQAGFWEIPAVASGEKVVTVKSNGLNADYNLLDANTASATTGVQLAGMDWSNGSVSHTGVYREERFYNGYLYICTGTNIWSRIPYDLIVKDYIIDDLDDSAGVKTSIQMTALYPNAVRPQVVYGVNGKYEYIGNNVWMYFENKIAV